MNLARLRELTAAGQAGTIRPEELKELFEALPDVIEAAMHDQRRAFAKNTIAISISDESSFDYDGYTGRFGY